MSVKLLFAERFMIEIKAITKCTSIASIFSLIKSRFVETDVLLYRNLFTILIRRKYQTVDSKQMVNKIALSAKPDKGSERKKLFFEFEID